MHLSLLIPLTGAAMNALCIFIIRLLDKDFIDGVKCHRNSMRKIQCETQMKVFLFQRL